MRVPEIVKTYAKRIDAMSLRERVLVFLAAAVMVIFIANNILLEPIFQRQRVNSQRNQQQQDEIQAMQAQLQAFAQARLSESAQAKRKRLQQRKAELAALDRELSGKQGELVSPERMSRMLAEILKRNPDVELLSLRSLPATSLTQVPTAAPGGAVIYRHGVEVTVAGSYFKTLGYLADLERNPARILWGTLELQAVYPRTTLKITLYTLSPDKTWLLI